MIATRFHAAALTLAGTLALAAPTTGAFANTTPAANVLAGGAAKVKGGLAVLITTRTVVPKPQRTVRFTGYATYSFAAPRGRRIVSASARILGAAPHAVRIRSRIVTHDRRRYTVSLIFPGEQGNPGKLRVILGTVA